MPDLQIVIKLDYQEQIHLDTLIYCNEVFMLKQCVYGNPKSARRESNGTYGR